MDVLTELCHVPLGKQFMTARRSIIVNSCRQGDLRTSEDKYK